MWLDEKYEKLIFAINGLLLIFGFIYVGRNLLRTLNETFEDIYREKRISIKLSTTFQSLALFLLFLRFLVEYFYWNKFGHFINQSLEANDWQFPVLQIFIVTFSEYLPIFSQVISI